VEGFEYFVFKGAGCLLKSNEAPDIIFEFVDWAESSVSDLSPGRAQQLLLDMGYSLFILRKDGRPVKMGDIMKSGSANLFASKKWH
jgi:hypothetical protein